MKIAVTSKSFSRDIRLVEALGQLGEICNLNTNGFKFSEDELVEFLKDADIAVIGLDRIDARVLGRLPKLLAISKYGVGTDNIDFAAIQDRGLFFYHRQGTNRVSVAELALNMSLTLIRKQYLAHRALLAGNWNQVQGRNLTGKAIGIVGLGNVGAYFYKLCSGFSEDIRYYDIERKYELEGSHGVRFSPFSDLLMHCDVVSLHVPLTKATRHFLGAPELSLMKKDALLINTARGEVVDTESLVEHLKRNPSFYAGLDVFENEPNLSDALKALPNVYITPHIGGTTTESILAMGLAAIEGVSRFLEKAREN
jgi:phosphoglycerate dehydrogenase-like enzyme